ncbi:MAG: hypothetical protein V4478_03325 [Patescibacteria group bacterium]
MKTIIISTVIALGILFGAYHIAKPQSFGAANAPTLLKNATNTGVAVGVASAAILTTNTARQNAVIVNGGSNAVYLGFGTAAVVGQGVYLAPSGGTYQINDQNLYIGAINGITSTQTSQVTALEIKQ